MLKKGRGSTRKRTMARWRCTGRSRTGTRRWCGCLQLPRGGSAGSCPIKIDEILVTSAWRPNVCTADRHISSGGRIPFGDYGMNTALGDSMILFGSSLRSWTAHFEYWEIISESGMGDGYFQNGKWKKASLANRTHLQGHDGENKDQGIGLDYPYNRSPVIVPDKDSTSLDRSRHTIRCQFAGSKGTARVPGR